MKNLIKYAAVGLAGYFVGFYEMKYHVVKAFAESKLKEDLQKSQKEEEEPK